MTTDDEFTSRLIGFGLSEKEALLYLHLLRYGPKTTSPLTKSLKTYRKDVDRTLTELIAKGMVRPSLDAPTIYAAVDLDTALEAALKKQESELREMEARKRELQELSERQHFRPSDEVATFRIIKNSKEFAGLALSTASAIEEELLFVFPTRLIAMMSYSGYAKEFKKLVERGRRVRGIADISCKDAPCAGIEPVEPVQELLDWGVDIRYLDHYHGLCFAVSDKKNCISIISGDVPGFLQSSPVTAPLNVLWTDDRIYAHSLTYTFELLWAQSVPAAQRIKEWLQERPRSLAG